MKSKKWKNATEYLQKAETWPENLGAGLPYNPDNRITQLMLAYCYENINRKALADKAFSYIQTYYNKDKGELDQAGNIATEFAKQNVRNYKIITEKIVKDMNNEEDYFSEFLAILK